MLHGCTNAAILHGKAETELSGIASGTTEKSLRIDCRTTKISQGPLKLLKNAVDAVEPLPEKWVELQVKNVGKDVEISVTDSGRGIPEKIRDKVGQPFFTTKIGTRNRG
jgi:C4-dicarboxylate-specific signal transduction histidine kinase